MNVEDVCYTPEVVVNILHTMRDGGYDPTCDYYGSNTMRETEYGSSLIGGGMMLTDPTGDTVCAMDGYRFMCEEVMSSMAVITDRQREAVMRVHVGGQLLREASEAMGVSVQCVSALCIRGVVGMSRWLGC